MLGSAITSMGQTTLPKPVRQALGVKSGDRIRYVIFDNEVSPLPIQPVSRLLDSLEYDAPHVRMKDAE